MVALASREQYCIHEEVSKQANKNEACTRLINSHTCRYFKNVSNFKTNTLPKVNEVN